MFENEISDAKRVVNEFLEQTALREGNLVVIGCSTSEIASKSIGSNMQIAYMIILVFLIRTTIISKKERSSIMPKLNEK